MDEWRKQLRIVVSGWHLTPEQQAEIVDELEQHLEQEYAEQLPLVGEDVARNNLTVQVNDPALRTARVLSRHQPTASVQLSRTRSRGWRSLVRDVRYGWRSLRTSPATSLMAAVALALGIGLTTVMFTVIYGLLLRGLPFEQSERIAMVMESSQEEGELALSAHDYGVYRDAQQSFESFGAWTPTTVNIAGDEQPERVSAARITSAVLVVPRVRPLLGRLLQPGDEVPDGQLVVVLSHALWRDRYAGDSGAVGRALRINGIPATIVGVMPEGFGFPRDSKLWLPLRLNVAALPWGTGPQLNGVGRLRTGVSLKRANADLAVIARRIEAGHAETNKGVGAVVQPFIRATVPGRVYALLYAMFGAVLMVFLVACTNAANLLLARAASRTREVAIRIALGASRSSIVRQFLVESLVLTMLSAVAGAFIAWGGIAVFRRAIETDVPFWADFRLHPQIFLFIAAIALAASVISGLLPALTASRGALMNGLKDQALGSSSMRMGKLSRVLVVFELALSSTLLIVAALATKSLINLRTVEPGFRTAGVMTGRVTLSTADNAKRSEFFGRLDERLGTLTGAAAVAVSTGLPGTGWSERAAAIEGQSYPSPRAFPSIRSLAVSPGFFKVFDVVVTLGRPIGEQDRGDALPVAVVNEQFVRRFFPATNPIGRRINLNPRDSVASWVTIVGVMPNLYAADPASVIRQTPWPPEVLTSFRQQSSANATIVVRGDGNVTAFAQPLRSIVASLDAELPVYSLSTMDDVLKKARWEVSVFGGIFAVFGVAALVLASVGLYAVIAFSVSRSERELGIRMALGAAASDVFRLVLRSAAVLLATGVSTGVLVGISVARLAGAVLFEVAPTDPAILSTVIGVLAFTGLLACVAPALRATKSDPVRSLRAE